MEQALEVQATISVLIPEDKILVDKVEYHELIIKTFIKKFKLFILFP